MRVVHYEGEIWVFSGLVRNTDACSPLTCFRGSDPYVHDLLLTGKETPNTDLMTMFSAA